MSIITMKLGRVFSLEYCEGDEQATLTEGCDEWFEEKLTKQELKDLANRMLDIALMMKDNRSGD